MKYLFITPQAIDHLIGVQQYQSADYTGCMRLIDFLKGIILEFHDSIISSAPIGDGYILYKDIITRDKGLFFDFEQFDTFLEEPPVRMIIIIQKLLRIAVKFFNKQNNFSSSERNYPDYLVVFPFPMKSQNDYYRVVIDKNSFRKGKPNILTVYYSGVEENSQKMNTTNVSKFYELFKKYDLPPASSNIKINNTDEQISGLRVVNISHHDFNLTSGLTLNEWKQYLTKPQEDFIFSDIHGAERLEGAAGTGKTLCLILKCIYNLRKSNLKKRYIFITHSLATKEHILNVFLDVDKDLEPYICKDGDLSGNLLVTTIQEWCIKYLGTNLAETEYLDADAMKSKNLQQFYIEEAYDKVQQDSYSFYEALLSSALKDFLNNTDKSILFEMLQYEIGVVIKGRAEGDIDTYKKLVRPHYGIPCEKDVDFNYIHLIYKEYQTLLENEAQFDSDDIVLTALSSLNAPIWRRRREREGFDACFIDETHLFNFNELSVFQYLNKAEAKANIIFAIDKSQYAGEILERSEDQLSIAIENGQVPPMTDIKLATVFRSSPDIVNLAYNIMSMGSSLFDNFDNPLLNVNYDMTKEEENKCFFPIYNLISSEDLMLQRTIEFTDNLVRCYKTSRANILIIATSDFLCKKVEKYLTRQNKPFEQISSRGDAETIKKAKAHNKYLFAGIDYVGGLEFDYVLIFGVDERNVPPANGQRLHSFHFANYAWHKRMYVALTRAKYGIALFGDKNNGISPILENAVKNEYIRMNDNNMI